MSFAPSLPRTQRRLRAGAALRMVLWGDSISEVGRSERWHGGASRRESHWGTLLAGRLSQAVNGRAVVEPVFAGIGGQNAYEGLGRLDTLWPLEPDLVLVEFGTNDCCHHPLQPDQTALAIDEMLGTIQQRGIDAVVLGTAGGAPGDTRFETVDRTNDAMRAVARGRGVPFVDLRHAIRVATDAGWAWGGFHLSATNCHPNDAGHRVWCDAVYDAVAPVLLADSLPTHAPPG